MNDINSIKLKVIQITQPVGDFFVGAISARDLFKITYADVRRLEHENRDVETYLGIQRPLDIKKRVPELKQYVRTVDACFPTGVILAVDGRCAEYDPETCTLTLFPADSDLNTGEESVPLGKIAKILDGQHRIAGLEDYEEFADLENKSKFEMNVTIFIDMDISRQAQIFAKVNLAQTKVNSSLAYDLAGLSKTNSPQRFCHRITVELNQQPGSPFYQQIKRLGTATKGRSGETITQATFVKSLLPYVTKNDIKDRDDLLRGYSLSEADRIELQQLLFRNLFLQEDHLTVVKILWAYFQAVADKWPVAWNDRSSSGTMLYRTNGFKALMRFFKPAYLHLTSPDKIGEYIPKSKFQLVFDKIHLIDEDFTIENFKPGGAGELSLYNRLMTDAGF